jgi:hypothetical protein
MKDGIVQGRSFHVKIFLVQLSIATVSFVNIVAVTALRPKSIIMATNVFDGVIRRNHLMLRRQTVVRKGQKALESEGILLHSEYNQTVVQTQEDKNA